jgi:hypothetical protein
MPINGTLHFLSNNGAMANVSFSMNFSNSVQTWEQLF